MIKLLLRRWNRGHRHSYWNSNDNRCTCRTINRGAALWLANKGIASATGNKDATIGDYFYDGLSDAGMSVGNFINNTAKGLSYFSNMAMDNLGHLFSCAEHAPWTSDPILLDLNGDGIKTTLLTNGVHFDFDNSGFAKSTAWVDSSDGLLVVDKNNMAV